MPTIASACIVAASGSAKLTPNTIGSRKLGIAAAVLVLFWLAASAVHAQTQASRKDDIVFGPTGHPVAGATILVCQSTATGTPCSPLATIYTDATMATTAPNPFTTDGLGNYHFYAAVGRYVVQISGPGLVGSTTYHDVILPSDSSALGGSSSNITAFGLTLGGNLTVAGNATVSGTLSSGTFNPSTLAVSGNGCFGGPSPTVDVTCPPYNAAASGGLLNGEAGSITSGTNILTVSSVGSAWKAGVGVVVDGAGASGSSLVAKVSAINSNQFTLVDIHGNPLNAGTTVTNAPMFQDDTLAIQQAINAVCALSGNNSATISFPRGLQGTYNITQTQTPISSSAPVLSVSGCGRIHFLAEGATGSAPQFARSPTIQMGVHAGSSPNSAPVFLFTNSSGNNDSIENLAIGGYNQAVQVFGANPFTFKNTCLAAAATSGPDNAPLVVYDSIWLWYIGGCLQPADGSHQSVIMAVISGGGIAALGPLYMSDTFINGGGILFSQRINQSGGPSGHLVFRNIQVEGSSLDFLKIQNDTGNGGSTAMPAPGPIEVDDLLDSDAGNNTNAVVNFNSSGSVLNGVIINHAGAGNSFGPAIKMTAGTLKDAKVTGCPRNSGVCSVAIVDGSGNPVGGAVASNGNGYDYTINSSDVTRLQTTKESQSGDINSGNALRLFQAGNNFANVTLDPAQGLLFGPGNYGYSGQAVQNAEETLGVGFATYLPPTGVTAAGASGGTIANGTYYYYVMSCATFSCAAHSTVSLAGSVTLSGSNGTANVSWTLPATATAAPGGYLVIRSACGPTFNFTCQSPAAFVSGASTTTYADNGSMSCCNNTQAFASMSEVHRFTATSLGVNTTNPQYNLDVNGTAAVNSLNGVQKAERFTGADAGVQINACLTAASTSSGVCDARGLTGTLTATHHISIPAGTTLLWGQAELSISDSGTNDAIELAGDGSSLIGYQESGLGTVPRPDTSGSIACGIAGCTTVKNPSQATRNVDWVHIAGVYLLANGASSKVIDMTSVGHSRVQDNQITVGTGGGSYGIYGDTSTGDIDSTNDIVQHNQINLESSNDVCVRLAGVFNINVIEINSCYFASANTGQEGFIYAKDSNGNYPNNSLLYGNDSEQGGASVSFGVIGYDIQGAQDITISNNRCEHIYACMKLPGDGSAVGVHMLDNYLSTSNEVQLLPNEPQAAQYAIDNNSHNWLPSQHFGLNDIAGPNMLGNAGFEGWGNSTTLYYWGGVSGTSINAAGSGIYAQQASSSAPADATTQGSYNVAIGDNATSGLGINSACIQVDATMEYTMALRVASTSTAVKFRPGFRFYSDPNCTEADRITSVSTNARVLAPANYAGQAALIGTTGPNWQSTNASLTYNNGITCNCNVTGADWNVGTASTWTPTRNFAVTFRVPDAYSSSTTVAQSMRVFIIENTAANPNKIYVDDAILSQGPASPNVPKPAPLADSGNPTEYGNLTVAGSLTVGSLPATLTSGTPTAGNCADFASSTTTNVQDAGSPCPSLLTRYSMGSVVGGQAPSGTNAVDVSVIYLPNIQFSKITVDVSTVDASTSDFYSWAITDLSGNVKCSITAVNVTAGGASDQSCTQGTVTLANGAYLFAFTGNATTGKIAYSGTAPVPLSSVVSSSTSSSGAMTFPISAPSTGVAYSGYGLPAIILH